MNINILDVLLFYCEEFSFNTAYYTKLYLNSIHYIFFTLILIENNARKKNVYLHTCTGENTKAVVSQKTKGSIVYSAPCRL